MTWAKPPVIKSADFARVQALPVRGDAQYPPNLAAEMTKLLKLPASTCPGGDRVDAQGRCPVCKVPQALNDTQARALYDLGTYSRSFLPVAVGRGKTLLSFLAPRMVKAERPLLVMPSNLVRQAERTWRASAAHWRIAKHLVFRAYEFISRVSGANYLDHYQPDLLICDEAHKLKSPKAAVTRRFARYMGQRPQTIFVPMSGGIMSKSIKDFAHLLEWSHHEHSPLPLYAATLAEWAEALDEGLNPLARRSPGVLLDLYPGVDCDIKDEDDDTRRARRIFFRRATACAGIVAADAKGDFEGSLQINALEYKPNAATEANFKILRETNCKPDGFALGDARQIWAVSRQLALGLHYEWDPPAPAEWLQARKSWAAFVRDTLKSREAEAKGWDSELQVTTAVIAGDLEDEYDLLKDWQAIKPKFTIDPKPTWHDPTALQVCAEWLADHDRGICWVEHVFFGDALSKMTGIPYFGPQGLDRKDNFIEDASGPIIASIAANSTGRNLQFKWSANLVTAPPMQASPLEQLIARTHRPGQTEDEVTVDILVGCREHLESIPRALSNAEVKADLLGEERQKLKIADIAWPELIGGGGRSGHRWA